VYAYISEPLDTFEGKIALLKKKGFSGVFWGELYRHMAGKVILPENSILLTFDDGYLDNWINVFPILQKYGMKATIFVNPDFVHPGTALRSCRESNSGKEDSRNSVQPAGFLNWAEMREMEASGLVDIQSHAMTHTWHFTGPSVVDYHRPHDIAPFPWLFWNERPDRKPFYMTEDQQSMLPWGYPIFEHDKALVARRFFPDADAIQKIVQIVDKEGGSTFFDRREWRRNLEERTRSLFRDGVIPGRYESDEEKVSRVEGELTESKHLIEKNLNKEVKYICWPGGANDEFVRRAAAKVGYLSWTLDSRSLLRKRNRPGEDPVSIKRMGTTNQVVMKGRYCGMAGPSYQLLRVTAHQGSAVDKLLAKAYKFAVFLRSLHKRK